jgi:hypothetical protein
LTPLNRGNSNLHLAKFFPGRWDKHRPAGTFNSGESGQDWVYEIVTKDYVHTGAEFCVQNKVIEKPRKHQEAAAKEKRRTTKTIKCRMQVSTLNYLVSISASKPVLLHFFDEGTKKGFWIWLHDFVQRSPQAEWQEYDTITVDIPRDSVMNAKAVKEIEAFVLREHHFKVLESRAINASLSNPNYQFITSRGPDWISIATYARHERALENEPISFTMTLGQEANETLIYAWETGEQVQFAAKRFQTEGPSASKTEPDIPEDVETVVTAIPLVPEETRIRKFQYLDDNDHELFSTGFLTMKLERRGTLVERWQGDRRQ